MFFYQSEQTIRGVEGVPTRVAYEQVKMLYEALPLSLVTVLVNSVILTLVQLSVVPLSNVIIWLSAIVLTSAGRFLLYRRFNRRNILFSPPSVWLKRFNIGVFFSGLTWGATALLMFPADMPIHQMFVGFVLAGMCAGAVTTLSASLMSIYLFVALALGPLVVRLLLESGDLSIVIAVMVLLFTIIVSLAARRSHLTTISSLKTRFAHELALAELQESTEHNRLLLESAGEGIFGVDMNGTTTFVNPAAAQMLGFEADELIGKTMHTMIHYRRPDGSHYPRDECPMSSTIESGKSRHVSDEVLWCKDGSPLPVEYRSTPIIKDGGIAGAVVTFSDISARKLVEEQLEKQAFYDVLTELPNRRLLLDRLEQAIVRAKRHGTMGALLFLDLDHFKTINDSLGHPVGDVLLQQVAKRLRNHVRAEDTAARMGGDEFVILFSELSHDPDYAVTHVQTAADKLCSYLAEPMSIGDHVLHVTPSIGIAMFPMNDETADDVLKQADAAMYRAKEVGRNGIQFFLPSMQLAVEEQLTLQNDLRYAIERGELQLHYQPQYGASGEVIGAEALLRWQHPSKGMISPADFIPVAEDTGQILAIGNWVLLTSCQMLRRMDEHFGAQTLPYIAVNVSPRQFRQGDFVEQVKRVLEQSGVAGERLELELTEGMLLDDVVETAEKMRALRACGVHFSIDDFGTGYSSLAYLKNLPLNKLKIDKSFTLDLGDNADSSAIVETIIAMANHLSLDVLAEGVENARQLAGLKEKGCYSYQGFYFSRPLKEADLLESLKQGALSG